MKKLNRLRTLIKKKPSIFLDTVLNEVGEMSNSKRDGK